MNNLLNNVFFLSVTTALFFGSYPLIIRKSGLPQAWIVLMLGLSSLVIGSISLLLAKSQTSKQSAIILVALTTLIVLFIVLKRTGMPAHKAIIIGLLASAWNGIGTFFYGQLLFLEKTQLSIGIPIMVSGMVLVTAIGGILLLGEPITLRKVTGICLAALAAYLLSA
jgi:drug/metabolite transporter (DMT)-like permease